MKVTGNKKRSRTPTSTKPHTLTHMTGQLFQKQYTAKGLEVIVTMRYKTFRHVENEKAKGKRRSNAGRECNGEGRFFFAFRYGG